jgi:4-methylaminobutanoate oxidase (formaldehyde-forming)
LIQAAEEQGVSFHSQTRVQGIETSAGQVRAVETTSGRLETETVVVACGIWSPLVSSLAGIALPLVPIQHQYAQTHPIPELDGRTLPNLRDPDKLVYLRERDGGLVVGGYERNPQRFRADIPQRSDPTVQSFEGAQFEPLWRAAVERVPIIESAGMARGTNGLESFTPDGEFLLGPASEVRGFWAACGFCAHGVSGAGGVGRVMAEWIMHGKPSLDVSHMRLDRFGPNATDPRFVERGAVNVYSTYYDLREPVQ